MLFMFILLGSEHFFSRDAIGIVSCCHFQLVYLLNNPAYYFFVANVILLTLIAFFHLMVRLLCFCHNFPLPHCQKVKDKTHCNTGMINIDCISFAFPSLSFPPCLLLKIYRSSLDTISFLYDFEGMKYLLKF